MAIGKLPVNSGGKDSSPTTATSDTVDTTPTIQRNCRFVLDRQERGLNNAIDICREPHWKTFGSELAPVASTHVVVRPAAHCAGLFGLCHDRNDVDHRTGPQSDRPECGRTAPLWPAGARG